MRAIKSIAVILLALLVCGGVASASRRSGSYKVKKPSYKAKPAVKGKRTRTKDYCASCVRDARGRIRRNPIAKRQFRQANPCPSTGKTTGRCSGYVIDHVVPLRRGGLDAPINMQWQTKEAARAKDKIED